MKLYTVLKMMIIEYIVIFVINSASKDITENHLKSQTHTNNKHERKKSFQINLLD